MHSMNIGIDFGGVLTATTTPPVRGDHLAISPRPNSYEVINSWKQAGETLILISKAGSAEKEHKARLWLAKYGFNELFQDAVYFCREQEGKVDICYEQQVDVMVDDTLRQLNLLKHVVPHLVLFNAASAPPDMHSASDWAEAKNVVAAL